MQDKIDISIKNVVGIYKEKILYDSFLEKKTHFFAPRYLDKIRYLNMIDLLIDWFVRVLFRHQRPCSTR